MMLCAACSVCSYARHKMLMLNHTRYQVQQTVHTVDAIVRNTYRENNETNTSTCADIRYSGKPRSSETNTGNTETKYRNSVFWNTGKYRENTVMIFERRFFSNSDRPVFGVGIHDWFRTCMGYHNRSFFLP